MSEHTVNYAEARAGAYGGSLLSGLGDTGGADAFSVLGWRQWFAQTGGSRSVAEVQARLGNTPLADPANPAQINPAAKNLIFAGDLQQTADRVTLTGPNGATAADLATVYARPDDGIYNPDADRPLGWTTLAYGLTSVEPVLIPNPDGGFRVGRRAGGLQIVVTENPAQPFNPKYVFRGTGMVDLATLSQAELNELPGQWTTEKGADGWQDSPTPTGSQPATCAQLVAPYAARLAAFEAQTVGLDDYDAVGQGVSKLGARLSIMADANRDPGLAAAGCGVPYPEAVGFSPNASENPPPRPRPAPSPSPSPSPSPPSGGGPTGGPTPGPTPTTPRPLDEGPGPRPLGPIGPEVPPPPLTPPAISLAPKTTLALLAGLGLAFMALKSRRKR